VLDQTPLSERKDRKPPSESDVKIFISDCVEVLKRMEELGFVKRDLTLI